MTFSLTPWQVPHEPGWRGILHLGRGLAPRYFLLGFFILHQDLEVCSVSCVQVMPKVNKWTCSWLVGLKNREDNLTAHGDVQERGYKFWIFCLLLHPSHGGGSMWASRAVDSHVNLVCIVRLGRKQCAGTETGLLK